jgi:hypothetical protein
MTGYMKSVYTDISLFHFKIALRKTLFIHFLLKPLNDMGLKHPLIKSLVINQIEK